MPAPVCQSNVSEESGTDDILIHNHQRLTMYNASNPTSRAILALKPSYTPGQIVNPRPDSSVFLRRNAGDSCLLSAVRRCCMPAVVDQVDVRMLCRRGE